MVAVRTVHEVCLSVKMGKFGSSLLAIGGSSLWNCQGTKKWDLCFCKWIQLWRRIWSIIILIHHYLYSLAKTKVSNFNFAIYNSIQYYYTAYVNCRRSIYVRAIMIPYKLRFVKSKFDFFKKICLITSRLRWRRFCREYFRRDREALSRKALRSRRSCR